jgi:rod shape-determining protein MreB
MEIKGRDLVAGIPKVVVASSEEIAEALVEPIHSIVETVHLTLEKTPPELAADIVDRGIMLVGGGSLLRDFDHVLRQETKLPILRSDDPFTAVVHGAGKALENLQLLKDVALT